MSDRLARDLATEVIINTDRASFLVLKDHLETNGDDRLSQSKKKIKSNKAWYENLKVVADVGNFIQHSDNILFKMELPTWSIQIIAPSKNDDTEFSWYESKKLVIFSWSSRCWNFAVEHGKSRYELNGCEEQFYLMRVGDRHVWFNKPSDVEPYPVQSEEIIDASLRNELIMLGDRLVKDHLLPVVDWFQLLKKAVAPGNV